MTQALEQRVTELEKKVWQMNGRFPRRLKNPWRTFGTFKDDPDYDEAMRLGKEWPAPFDAAVRHQRHKVENIFHRLVFAALLDRLVICKDTAS